LPKYNYNRFEQQERVKMTGRHLFNLAKLLILTGILSLATGCATTQNSETVGDNDPLEPTNRVFFDVTETLDKHLLKPIAESYVDVTPLPVRTSITNFFDNLNYLNVILNDFLQGKFHQGITDMLRFTYNSTFGIAGLFDISTPIGMPANDEDFGQTLATWGVEHGSYLYILGPSSLRDITDEVPSTLLNPFFYVTSAVMFPVSALNAVNKRANLLEASSIRDEAALDTYSFTREAYLQQREFLIYDGEPPASGYDDIFGDDDDTFSDAGTGDGEESGMLVIE
jgi:phospholipid-binding lipoprotein MlaA